MELVMKKVVNGIAIIAILVLMAVPQTGAHEYGEVKEGRWEVVGRPQCEGYNLDTFFEDSDSNDVPQVDEFRFSQFGHRVVVSGLKYGQPRVSVSGEVSEEFIHFEILESRDNYSSLYVWVVEILDDEEELDYSVWATGSYANEVWTECSGYWLAGTCSGKSFITGVPNFPEGYERYSVKCTGMLEWQGQ